MTERFTPDMTKALVSSLGEDGARAYFAKYPELDPSMDKIYPEVQPDDVDAYYVNPSAFKKNLGGKSSALAVEGAPDAPAAAPAMGGPEEGGPMAALNARVEAYQKRVTDLRKQQFDAAEKSIAAQRAGPGVGERLAQLSAAFASPTRTRGFGGMMANVMPVMAKQQEEERLGKTALADKLQALRDKYASGQLEDEGDALKYRMELAKLEDEQRKAAEPKVEANPVTGVPQLLPRYAGIAKPKNDAEWALLPPGTPYVGYAGKGAGKLAYKLDRASPQ